ncbi:DUF4301 family protein [Gaetbulibacter aestuarii]|uniref:DUF4301 family protein n=1 Tax=Gaetbulibacter aestuarii TaxID=1502358 RepID=A0ABW7MYV8_9FLAO
MFTDNEIAELKAKGKHVDDIGAQIAQIKKGMSYSHLVSAATVGDGIERFDYATTNYFIRIFESSQEFLDIIKFVPASGAATRMFKFLFNFLDEYDPFEESVDEFADKQPNDKLKTFISEMEYFPFYDEVVEKMEDLYPNYDNLDKNEVYVAFVKAMLSQEGLNFSFLPKGLLPFHTYGKQTVTAFYEHMQEATLYASAHQKAKLHFTVSEKHLSDFASEWNTIKTGLEEKTATSFDVSFSTQSDKTDTIALTEDNKIFKHNGKILFRPAGHGALLENLNALEADLIFIKNIDNIVVFNKNREQSRYKKLLAGVLLNAQEQVFNYLHDLDKNRGSETELLTIASFLNKTLNVKLDEDFEDFSLEEKASYLHDKLNRPIRVCGMVENKGEPGGGPFWVRDSNGDISLQIVEFAQIDIHDKKQKAIVKKATHFNPTDLVCGVKDYKGNHFNLMDFTDPDTAFINMKTQNGRPIKALERPGLWNGSMAYWNTIFVEVPLDTFNPVKTVNDLLKPEHRGS